MNTEIFLNSYYKDESEMTCLCFRWVNANFPQLRGDFFHVPNEFPYIQGGNKFQYNAIIEKRRRLGVTPGIPDFICMNPRFAIELKMPKGSRSEVQKSIHEKWLKFMPVYTVKTLLEFHNIVIDQLNNYDYGG